MAAASLDDFLARPSAQPHPDVLRAIDAPIDPADALPWKNVDRLLDPAPLPAETGWCVMGDGVGYVAVRTPMPGTNAAMWDWWFDWHQREAKRYRVWYPEAHFDIAFKAPPRERAKPFWGATHFPEEDVGLGRETLRIDFKAPTEYGFSTDALDDPDVGTIVGGFAGSRRRHARHTVMAHVFLRDTDGLLLRSRFWIGAALRPYLPGAAGDALGWALNRPVARRALPLRAAAEGLARHCAAEYARLAAMLPELYASFGPSEVSLHPPSA
jgi:hypothetical protein